MLFRDPSTTHAFSLPRSRLINAVIKGFARSPLRSVLIDRQTGQLPHWKAIFLFAQ